MNDHQSLALPDGYNIEPIPLKGRSTRSDWSVTTEGSDAGVLDGPTTTSILRRLFAGLYTEADRRKGDPIATGRALLNAETLLRDLRSLVAKLKTDTATAMDDLKVRRITLEGVGVWEASTSVNRSNWQTARAVSDYLTARGVQRAVTVEGEYIGVDVLGVILSELYGPSNGPRMTPLREVGLKPDDYCDIELGEDEKPIRTPGVRVHDNRTGVER